jgi:Tol biopolymer transport system component
MTGKTLGPYQILDRLGSGGMGEVYRARDTRLDRVVAIKVLPPALASDPEFRQRFEREAKSISALTHPNICTLYDIGSQDGVEFLVMECLEGETLAARLERGALPTDEALSIAIDVASALDRAHRQGIVHRDLKPGNVMLTKAGAKLLDFGLAKAAATPLVPNATTIAMRTSASAGPLTGKGTILGTFQYMAPEQIEGEQAGARADIFAFGAMLFEMLTGRRAFDGKTEASVLGAILKEAPPSVSQVQPMVPPALDRVVKTCLAKDPDDRFQTAHDLWLQLRWIREGGSAAGVPAPVIAHRRHRERTAWIALAVVVVLWLATLYPAIRALLHATPEPPKIQFAVETPDVLPGGATTFALSPDGRLLAFAMHGASGAPSLWVRSLDELQPRAVPGTEGATSPFWSPDSRHLAFAARGTLMVVDVSGGSAQALGSLTGNLAGGTWNRDGTILFAQGSSRETLALATISDKGGPIRDVSRARSQQGGLAWPTFLPDGRRFLYLVWSRSPAERGIYAGSLDGDAPVLVLKVDSTPPFLALPGWLLYVRERTLLAQPFDLGRLQVTGDPLQIADGIGFNPVSGQAAFTASATGALAFRAGSLLQLPLADLAWLDRKGHTLGTAGDPGSFYQVRLSPDEKRVAVALPSGGGYNIWTLDLGSRIMTQSTFEAAANDPVWSPDSLSLAYESARNDKRDFYRQTVGSRDWSLLFGSPENPKWLDDWSRDSSCCSIYRSRRNCSRCRSREIVSLASSQTHRQSSTARTSHPTETGSPIR